MRHSKDENVLSESIQKQKLGINKMSDHKKGN